MDLKANLNFLLLLFVFSLPFETWDPFGIASFFSINKMAGFGYAAFCILNYKTSFNIKYVFPAVRLLFLIWLWIGVQSILNFWDGTRFSIFNITLFQNIILFWLLSSHLIKSPLLIKDVFLTFILSIFFMSILIIFGIGVEREISDSIGNSRLTFFGNNSNTLGVFLSLSIILVGYLILNRNNYFGKISFLLLLTIPPSLSLLGLTGSRGALGIVLVGLLVIFSTHKANFPQKISLLFMGSLFLIIAINKALESDVMQKRVTEFFEEGDLAGRELIWQRAINIFYDYPFTGVGTTGFEREMLNVHNRFQDTHNLYLYLLVTGGIIGLSIYLLFFYKVLSSGWENYKKKKDSLALVLLFIYVFTSLKSGGFINDKFMWLLLAIIYSSKYSLSKR